MAPTARHTASYEFSISSGEISTPTRVLVLNSIPSSSRTYKPAVDYMLGKFEIRDAISEKSSRHIIFFENRHPVPCLVEKISTGKSSRTGTDNCYLFAAPYFWRLWPYKSLLKAFFGGGSFIFPYGNRLFMMASTQAGFTGRRTYPSRKFGKLLVTCSRSMAFFHSPRYKWHPAIRAYCSLPGNPTDKTGCRNPCIWMPVASCLPH
jgi:hypothetical protein